MTRETIVIALAVLCVGALTVRVYAPKRAPVDLRVPRRPGSDKTLRIPERCPSAGLDWSVRRYPAQYGDPANRAAAAFAGLDDRENERFLDIGGRAYSRAFLERFSYTEPGKTPDVRVEYLRRAEAFAGRIVGSGLKPNFAYQVKLRGVYSADRDAFERIGRLGRWRLPGTGTNFPDAAYEAFPAKEKAESYLLFDFLVTDPDGRAEKTFYADSSLHVLWSVNHQRNPRSFDGCRREHARESSDPGLYANPRPELSAQELFAESEQHSMSPENRPPVNEAFLPPGRYRAELVLTEESFHGFGDSGFWATVMVAPVEFEVIEQARPTPGWQKVNDGAVLSLSDCLTTGIDSASFRNGELTGRATAPAPMVLFSERLNLPPGRRYVLRADVLARGRHAWSIFLDKGSELRTKPSYVVDTQGSTGWQPFEVEITRSRSADRLRIMPARAVGAVGLRNVRICEVAE